MGLKLRAITLFLISIFFEEFQIKFENKIEIGTTVKINSLPFF